MGQKVKSARPARRRYQGLGLRLVRTADKVGDLIVETTRSTKYLQEDPLFRHCPHHRDQARPATRSAYSSHCSGPGVVISKGGAEI